MRYLQNVKRPYFFGNNKIRRCGHINEKITAAGKFGGDVSFATGQERMILQNCWGIEVFLNLMNTPPFIVQLPSF